MRGGGAGGGWQTTLFIYYHRYDDYGNAKFMVFIFKETLPDDSSTIFVSRHKSGKTADFLVPEIVGRADESHFGRTEM
jgi:hypothetical protein